MPCSGMGLEVEMGHHEVALGQHEIDFRFADALRTADNVLTLKYTVKAIAAQHGLVASFMPKPIFGINGSGMHCHQSLFDAQGNNLFFDPNDEYHLSPLAYGFIAGQLAHARAAGGGGRPHGQLLQAPGARLRSAGVRRLGADQPLGADPHPALHHRAATRPCAPSCASPIHPPTPTWRSPSCWRPRWTASTRSCRCPKPLNNVNVYHLTAEERQAMGIAELPGSLAEALRELDNDEVLQGRPGSGDLRGFHPRQVG